MNDTTRWIMIILLLLLIAAAVFMLLRSPGKDKDGEAGLDRGADREGVAPLAEDRSSTGTSGRGVYDQEADQRAAAPVETSAYDETATTPVEGRAAQPDGPVHGTSTYDDTPAPAAQTADPATDPVLDPAAERAAGTDVPAGTAQDGRTTAYEDGRLPEDEAHDRDAETYHPEAGATEEAVRPGTGGATAATAGLAGAAEAHDDRQDEPREVHHDVHRDDRDLDRAAAHDGVGHEGGGTAVDDVQPLTDDQITDGGREEPLTRDEQQPFTGGTDASHEHGLHDADGTRTDDARTGDAHARPEQQTLPVDAGTGAPQTADDIVRDDPSQDEYASAPPAAAPAFDDGTRAGTGDRDETAYERPADVQPAYDDRPADVEPVGDGRTGEDHLATPAPVFAESTYGAGSAEPLDDGSGPAGWEVKGNIGSMLFHTPESPSWDAVRAEVWFEDEEAARAAGFAHWDRRRR